MNTKDNLTGILSAFALRLSGWIGSLLNLAGLPGFVQECNYAAGVADAHVAVRRTRLYTVVTVNGLDVYFHRITGAIDGVGFSLAAHCKRPQFANRACK